jgi:hypothetical protein
MQLALTDDGGDPVAVRPVSFRRYAIPRRGCYVRPGDATIEDREIVTCNRPPAEHAHDAGKLVRWPEPSRYTAGRRDRALYGLLRVMGRGAWP